MNSNNDGPFESGLTHRQPMALSWETRQDSEEPELLAAADGNARLLQTLPIFEERRAEQGEDETERSQDLLRLEAKLDTLLELVSELLRARRQRPLLVPVTLGADGMAWTQAGEVPAPEQRIWVDLYVDEHLPRALRLAARVIAVNPDGNQYRVLVIFEHLGESVADLLEKLIFRHHRREVARIRSKSQDKPG